MRKYRSLKSFDAVIVFTDVDPQEVCRNGFHGYLQVPEDYLDRKIPSKTSQKRRTAHSIQFLYDRKVDVDMLISPFWSEPRKLYEFLETIPSQRERFK